MIKTLRKTTAQLERMYKKQCKEENKQASGKDFLDNFIEKYLNDGNEIIL